MPTIVSLCFFFFKRKELKRIVIAEMPFRTAKKRELGVLLHSYEMHVSGGRICIKLGYFSVRAYSVSRFCCPWISRKGFIFNNKMLTFTEATLLINFILCVYSWTYSNLEICFQFQHLLCSPRFFIQNSHTHPFLKYHWLIRWRK